MTQVDNVPLAGSSAHLETLKGANYDSLIKEIQEESLDKRDNKKKQTKKVTAQGVIERSVQPQDIVKGFANKMAQSEIMLNDGLILDQVKQELAQDMESFYKKSPSSSDQVVLSAQVGAKSLSKPDPLKETVMNQDGLSEEFIDDQKDIVKKEAAQKLQNAKRQKNPISPTLKRAQDRAMNQYLQKYSESIVKGDSSSKQDKQRVKEELVKLKMPEKHIQHAEAKVRGLLRKDLKKRLKTSFLEMALSFSGKKITAEVLQRNQRYDALLQGAYDSGAINGAVPSLEAIKDEARNELQSFLADELDYIMTTSKINGASSQSLIEAFNRYNDIATIAKFSAPQYLRHFNKKCENLGLNYFQVPPEKGVVDTDVANDKALDSSSQDASSGQERSKEDQKEYIQLMDEIRSLYMEKAIRKDFKSQFEIGLKLRKSKKRLEKYEADSTKMLEKLQKEGIEEAKARLWDMVREGLEERATLVDVKGTEGKIVQHKISHALKRIKVLGGQVNKVKLIDMRDHINQTMFSIIKEEYLKISALMGDQSKNTALKATVKKYTSILERLKEESDIKEDIEAMIIQNLQLSDQTSIIEAA